MRRRSLRRLDDLKERSMIEVPLTQGRVALIDDEDAERVLIYKWTYAVRGKSEYARRAVLRDGTSHSIYLHRFILDAPSRLEVDHINGDGLDNRRCNLRLATKSQNHCNASVITRRDTGFRGVYVTPDSKRYNARIVANGSIIRVGPFGKAEDAARAYDVLAKHYHGEFAALNFPSE
jgi:hypothetical protein